MDYYQPGWQPRSQYQPQGQYNQRAYGPLQGAPRAQSYWNQAPQMGGYNTGFTGGYQPSYDLGYYGQELFNDYSQPYSQLSYTPQRDRVFGPSRQLTDRLGVGGYPDCQTSYSTQGSRSRRSAFVDNSTQWMDQGMGIDESRGNRVGQFSLKDLLAALPISKPKPTPAPAAKPAPAADDPDGLASLFALLGLGGTSTSSSASTNSSSSSNLSIDQLIASLGLDPGTTT